MKHLRKDCTAHHITFGGGCLNCGAGMGIDKQISIRKANIKAEQEQKAAEVKKILSKCSPR